jgi:hypothetical protein
VGHGSQIMCSCPAHQNEAICRDKERPIHIEPPAEQSANQRKKLSIKAAKKLKAKNGTLQSQNSQTTTEPNKDTAKGEKVSKSRHRFLARALAPRKGNDAVQSETQTYPNSSPSPAWFWKSEPGVQRHSWQQQATNDCGWTAPLHSWMVTTQPTNDSGERAEETPSHSTSSMAALHPPAFGRTVDADGLWAQEERTPVQELTEAKQRRLRRLRRATWNDYVPQVQCEPLLWTSTSLNKATQCPEIPGKDMSAQTLVSGAEGIERQVNRGVDQGSPISPLLWLAQHALPFQPETQLSSEERDIEGWLRVQDMLDGRVPVQAECPGQQGHVPVQADLQDVPNHGAEALGLYFPNWQHRYDEVLEQYEIP